MELDGKIEQRYKFEFERTTEKACEILLWLRNNCSSDEFKLSVWGSEKSLHVTAEFERAEDAALFKLKWDD